MKKKYINYETIRETDLFYETPFIFMFQENDNVIIIDKTTRREKIVPQHIFEEELKKLL